MSLTIIEKQPQRRPGGCAGIFFQLLDWNRRLTRKKLFSKKLLPPVRPVKRRDKKLVGDEKLPREKLILIANENRGGFPNGKIADADESLRNETRTPGLVARLMGLDSMPDTEHDKPRKTLDSEIYYDRDESVDYTRLDRKLCHSKPDSRPQKLQKTEGFFERKPIGAARFSPDVTHKSAVLRSRMQQHMLDSRVKGPRLLSRGNQVRLMVAATKILEHGLQSRSTSRRSISCDVVSLSETIASEAAIDQNDSVGPCRSCVGVVDFSQVRRGVKEALGAQEVNASSQPSVEVEFDTRGLDRDSVERKYLSVSDQIKHKHQYPRVNNPKATSRSSGSSRILRKAELPMSRDNVVHGSKLCRRRRIDNDTNEFMASKDCVGAKKKLSSSPGLKCSSKISTSYGVNTDGILLEKCVVHKRRSNDGSLKGNGTTSNSNFINQRSIPSVIINKKEPRLLCSHPINRSNLNNGPQKTVRVDTFGNKDTGIVSFTFRSPINHVSPSSMKETSSAKSGGQMKRVEHVFQPKRLVLTANMDTLTSPRRKNSLRSEELSHLLEEKIWKLNSLDQHDAIRDTPTRSTASILKELTSTLAAEESTVQSTHFEKDDIGEDYAMLYMKSAERNHGFDISDISQTIQARRNVLNDVSLVSDSNHPSPISIFDASFSCESCSVGSFNGCADFKGNSSNYSKERFTHKCNRTLLLDLDLELLDSPTSFDSDIALQSSVEDIFTSISAAFFSRSEPYLCSVRITLENFLFDCLVESMATRFDHFSFSGYKMRSKLPILFNKDKLFKSINDEIVSLMELAGKPLDGLAEQELSSSTICWAKFEAQVSEMCVDMERAIFQELVDEVIADLCVVLNPGSAF